MDFSLTEGNVRNSCVWSEIAALSKKTVFPLPCLGHSENSILSKHYTL